MVGADSTRAGTRQGVPLDPGFATARTTGPTGLIETVTVPFGTTTPPSTARAYLTVDAYPAATVPVP